jgi:hypothetical protein
MRLVFSLGLLSLGLVSLVACTDVDPVGSTDAGPGEGGAGEGEGEGGEGEGGEGEGEGEGGEGEGGEGEGGEGEGGEGEGEGEGEGPGEGEGEGEEDPGAVTRFVAVGDSGKGNDGQYRVADAMGAVCAARGGCAFALLLGDNIYDAGVADRDDAQWQEKFELPYAALDFPFYATLGNHDYGAPDVLQGFAGGIGIDPRRGAAQVDYAASGDKFFMPDTHYRLQHGPLELVSVNTASMFWADLGLIERAVGYDDENDRQRANLAAWAADPLAGWRVAFGHHPYLSNGPHGNAGRYDNVIIDGLIGSGTELKAFFEEHVLGTFDVYLCGHDHSLQDLGDVDGTELLVSGGGSTHTDLDGENPVVFEADRRGFLIVEATATTMTFQFVVLPDDGDAVGEAFTFGPARTITR